MQNSLKTLKDKEKVMLFLKLKNEKTKITVIYRGSKANKHQNNCQEKKRNNNKVNKTHNNTNKKIKKMIYLLRDVLLWLISNYFKHCNANSSYFCVGSVVWGYKEVVHI